MVITPFFRPRRERGCFFCALGLGGYRLFYEGRREILRDMETRLDTNWVRLRYG